MHRTEIGSVLSDGGGRTRKDGKHPTAVPGKVIARPEQESNRKLPYVLLYPPTGPGGAEARKEKSAFLKSDRALQCVWWIEDEPPEADHVEPDVTTWWCLEMKDGKTKFFHVNKSDLSAIAWPCKKEILKLTTERVASMKAHPNEEGSTFGHHHLMPRDDDGIPIVDSRLVDTRAHHRIYKKKTSGTPPAPLRSPRKPERLPRPLQFLEEEDGEGSSTTDEDEGGEEERRDSILMPKRGKAELRVIPRGPGVCMGDVHAATVKRIPAPTLEFLKRFSRLLVEEDDQPWDEKKNGPVDRLYAYPNESTEHSNPPPTMLEMSGLALDQTTPKTFVIAGFRPLNVIPHTPDISEAVLTGIPSHHPPHPLLEEESSSEEEEDMPAPSKRKKTTPQAHPPSPTTSSPSHSRRKTPSTAPPDVTITMVDNATGRTVYTKQHVEYIDYFMLERAMQ